ncbi:MAG TPA: ABC transporter permease [Acidobacteriaceae bacterium]|jgi:putative ABC transport system permease protein
MNSWIKDLRYSARRLGKARGFFLTVTLMLALGIGAITTIFSVIEGILLRPLPFRDPDRLVQLGEHVGEYSGIGITARDIRAYSTEADAFSSMGAFIGATFVLSGGPTPENLPAARLTSGVFPTLGVEPSLGRTFSQQEEGSRAQAAVISYALWTDRYHRDPHAIGSTIELDRKPYTIIGVMPRNFDFPLQVSRLNQAQLWVPMSLTADELSEESAGFWGYQMVGRLKEGVTLPQAAQDAARVSRQIMSTYPPSMSKIRVRGDVQQLGKVLTGDTRPLLRVLLIAVSVVLLIACTNVAVLMLVRAVRSHREHAIRLALGARTGAILRGSTIEGLLLSLTGGLFGLLLAFFAVRIAVQSLAGVLPRVDAISINGRVAMFALGIALLTGVLCSLVPAFVALRINPIAGLKENAVTATGAASHARLRSTLVVLEIGVAFALLISALAFLRSYQKMLAVDPGFQPQHVLVAGYRLPAEQYPTDVSVDAFTRALTARLSNKPGILAVGVGTTLPSSGNSGMAAYTIEGQSVEGWKLKFAAFGSIYGNYFQALGIPLIAGRTFTEEDRADSPLVVIVSQSMAQHSWPGQSPIGKRMHVGNPKKNLPWATVVGVVGDTRIGGRDQKANDAWYAPALQPAILYGAASPHARVIPAGGSIVVRAAIPPEEIIGTVRKTVAEIDPELALDQVRSMKDVVSTTEAPRRIMTELVTIFAVTALMLALTGIYAVMSFSVTLRTHEIAIRMALGAQRRSITKLVLQAGARLALLGSVLGTLGSLAASHLIRSFLFEVSPIDPWIYTGSVLLMMAIAYVASVFPAIRAASADPIKALRSMS